MTRPGEAGLLIVVALSQLLGVARARTEDELPLPMDDIPPPGEEAPLPVDELPPSGVQEESLPPAGDDAPASDPNIQQEVPLSPAERLEIARKKRRKLEADFTPWPGRYFGLRAGGSIGGSIVPRFGLASENTGRTRVSQIGPYFGVDFGYAQKRWGAAVAVEWCPIVLSPPAYLKTNPHHWVVTLQVAWVPNRRWRHIVGLTPYSSYWLLYPTNQLLIVNGFGFRFGGSVRMNDPGPRVLETFYYLSHIRFTRVEGGFGKNMEDYNSWDFVGTDVPTSSTVFVMGLQLNFQL